MVSILYLRRYIKWSNINSTPHKQSRLDINFVNLSYLAVDLLKRISVVCNQNVQATTHEKAGVLVFFSVLLTYE